MSKRKPESEETIVHSVEAFGTWAEEGHSEEPLSDDEQQLSEQVLVPVDKLMPTHIKEFLQKFALLHTIRTHVDPETNMGEYESNEQLATEVKEWIKSNPKFTKKDLYCMKVHLHSLDFPKHIRHDLLQDMRGKTFHDLCLFLLQMQKA